MFAFLVPPISPLDEVAAAAPTSAKAKPRPFNAGTVRPPENGTYEMKDGGYSRFYNGHWRAPNQCPDAASTEERLSTFALPPMRHLERHAWRVIDRGG